MKNFLNITGKILITLIAIVAIYRCCFNQPIYYGLRWGLKHSEIGENSKIVPTVDLFKLSAELMGMGIGVGLIYWLMVKK